MPSFDRLWPGAKPGLGAFFVRPQINDLPTAGQRTASLDRVRSRSIILSYRDEAICDFLGEGARLRPGRNKTIPIVLLLAENPVRVGLVANLAQPAATSSVNFFSDELTAKRLALLR